MRRHRLPQFTTRRTLEINNDHGVLIATLSAGGDIIDAADALRVRLARSAVPADQLMHEALARCAGPTPPTASA